MGVPTDADRFDQLKKAQDETNDRLDKIAKLLEDQNRWLALIAETTQSTAP